MSDFLGDLSMSNNIFEDNMGTVCFFNAFMKL